MPEDNPRPSQPSQPVQPIADVSSLLRTPVRTLNLDTKISGGLELQQEIVRSRIMQGIAAELANSGIDPSTAGFEFGLVIKW